MSSLRNKILLSTSVSKLALLLMAIVVYADLKYLQDQIVESENIREFLSSTQQLQNHEENLLLHRAPDAYSRLLEQIERTRADFTGYRPVFEGLVDSLELEATADNLAYYRGLLDQLYGTDGEITPLVEDRLRATSEAITRSVRMLGQRHHQLLSEVTQIVSWTLAGALTLAILIGIASALFVIRQIIKPIRTLETQLDAVADGDMQKLTLASDDVEIQSFVQHFNNMLERLRSQGAQLRHHEKAAAMGVLVSGVAHELNNPLSNISTSAQLLLEDNDTSADLRQQWLAHIDSETERARRIVRRLLDSVRQPTLNMQSVSAAELVRAAALLIHRQLDPDIFLDIEDVPDACIKVDRERLQQVFINLIRNAVDAGAKNIWVFGDITSWEDSRPDEIERVQGAVSGISDADAVLLFTIADDGPGIPEENLAQLFTPFFTTKSGGEGTGLGLYLVEEIIDEHHGCITVENRREGGSQFLIWLPLASEDCDS